LQIKDSDAVQSRSDRVPPVLKISLLRPRNLTKAFGDDRAGTPVVDPNEVGEYAASCGLSLMCDRYFVYCRQIDVEPGA
jgi:hypothetical protein